MRIERPFGDPEAGGPVLYIANHSIAYGPVSMYVAFDRRFRPWVISNVCHMRTFPAFARMDFFHPKNPVSRAFFWVASYILAPVGQWLFANVEAIPAHFSRDIVKSLQKSMETLEEGISLLIFPEERKYFSPYVEEFQDGFAYVARQYWKRYKKRLRIVPVYSCAWDKTITLGQPVEFDPKAPFDAQKRALAEYCRDAIDGIARSKGAPPEYDEHTYHQD